MGRIGRPGTFSAQQVAAFRMSRHHLSGNVPLSLASVCVDVGGIQAQVMSAAELSLWTRRRRTTRADVKAALWKTRDLVKTTSMRRTLHLLPVRDFSMYIAAMQEWSMGQTESLLRRIGASAKHVDTMIAVVMDALADGPKTQQDLLARAKAKAGKGMRVWLQYAWSAMRPAILQGLIVYAEPRGGEAMFVRVDQWLPRQKKVDAGEAQAELALRYLSAFGPATFRDFSKWSGLPTGVTRPLFDRLGSALQRVDVEGATAFVRRGDLAELASATIDASPRLLPSFDTFLLAHAVKDHLVEPRFYKQVYRNQGWLSPVVIAGGRIVAVWSLEERARSYTVNVRPFGALSRHLRDGIHQEAEALSQFVEGRCEAIFG
jgi:hypothetical protein